MGPQGGIAEAGVASRPRGPQADRRARGGFQKDTLRRRLLAPADLDAVLAAAAVVGPPEGAQPALLVGVMAPLRRVLAKTRGLYDRDRVRIRYLTAMLGGRGAY